MSNEPENEQSAIRNSPSAIGALRRFVRPRPAAAAATTETAFVERCEMCSAALGAEHQHLVEPSKRQMVCACEPCAILFSGEAEKKFKRVPRRIRALPEFRLTDGQWDNLMIPIQLAFFYHSTPDDKVLAFYPSPAGAIESLLALDSWNEVVEDNPVLRELEPDVEALLVNRVGGGGEYYIVPIDECYKLVGLIRAHWRGLSGGTEVWREIKGFYEELKERAVPVKTATTRA
ncbi:MAG TPA: DUF5947 family protein [Pyrinomonadaceae bacterium]|jgi:hypothetical protein|nr:DUF5947 family protein [Pyrinomonadaceae bacterium]